MENNMSAPGAHKALLTPSMSWKDATLSSRARVALYLSQEVGEGNQFHKNAVREALPGIEQVDRRMRELREVGWIIRNYKDHPSLKPNELLLENVGDAVWEVGYKSPASARVSGKVQRQVFDRDGNRCVVCGVAAGEEYPNRPGVIARMTIGHLVPKGRKGWNSLDNLRTECSFCNETVRHLSAAPVDPELLKAQIKEMPRRERALLASWVIKDKRDFTMAEELWAKYRQLPAPQRDEVRDLLAEFVVEAR
jgi:5-methylcytosine-specific restriction endonuclease McrA